MLLEAPQTAAKCYKLSFRVSVGMQAHTIRIQVAALCMYVLLYSDVRA